MAIDRLETDHYRIPLSITLSDSTHGNITHFELVTVRLTDADGAEGMGYTYTVDAGGAAIHAMIDRELRGIVEGAASSRIEALWKRMLWGTHFVGRGGVSAAAISAVDIALWDLAAKRAGCPLWRLLGGNDAEVRAYAGGIDLQFTTDALLKQTEGNLARGFGAIKMKVGRTKLSEDVDRVRAMREMLGADFPLMADANMHWRVDEAIRAARAMTPYELTWLEEPTIPEDIPGHVRILKEGGLPIAAGENLRNLHEFRALMAAGGVSFPEPDVAMCGGVTVWMKVAHMAEAFNLPVTSHGVHDLHVHLLAAVPNPSYLEAHGFGLDKFIAEPLRVVEGFATAPERPGHGIVFDWKGLERLRG